MLVIPYSAELGLARKPIITYSVIILCIIIYLVQANNREQIEEGLYPFCNSIYDQSLESNDIDLLRTNINLCTGFLYNAHTHPDNNIIDLWLSEINHRRLIFTEDELAEAIKLANNHYYEFSQHVPKSLDSILVYNPSSWNPLRTVTSALSHGDWMHVIGNLIFFFAFAAAIEIILDSKFRFIIFMLIVAFATDITYSLSILIGSSPPLPSLGLSGVVSGVIGLSAYLMPRARIRTFVWFIVFVARSLPIPAWILALWFIGWDAYYLMAYSNTGGINLVAHVSGGVAGFLFGYLFLKNRKEEIRDELNEEIEFMKSTRSSRITTTSSYRGGDKYLQHLRERDTKREYANYNQKLYRLVNSGNNGEAINLLLQDYDHYKESIEIYEELFDEMEKWRACRTLMCLGRLIISLLLENNEPKKALLYTTRCLKLQKEFVLSSPKEAINLANHAYELQEYVIAYQIINSPDQRYGEYISLDEALLLETKLLLIHMNRRDESKIPLKKLIDRKPMHLKHELKPLVEIYKGY